MLISCPKCVAVYNIAADKIPEQGRRFKCVECGNVWTVYPKDVSDIEPENKIKTQKILQNENDMREMFSRLSKDTDDLFVDNEEKTFNKTKSSAQDKITQPIDIAKRKMQVFFSPFLLNGLILFFIAVFTMFIGYYNRYEIVRFAPAMEDFYNNLNLDCVYTARNVVFDQLNVKQVEHGSKHFVEISGRLYNQGPYKAKLLPIIATLENNSGEVMTTAAKLPSIKDLAPNMSSMFFIILENRTAEAKIVRLSFAGNGK